MISLILMSNLSHKNILFSSRDNLLMIHEEPIPNCKYLVRDIDNIHNDCIAKVDEAGINFVNSTGTSILTTKRKRVRDSHGVIVNWLNNKSPDLMNTTDMFKDGKTDVIIKGYVQSGKTSFMLCSALKYMYGTDSMSSIIILRDSIGDSRQIENRLNGLRDEICSEIGDVIDLCIFGSHIGKKEFKSAMTGDIPKIIVLLGNGVQMKRLNRMMNDIGGGKFALFIDEADSNDTGETKRTTELESIKEQAKHVYYISATILEIGLRETENKQPGNIYMLQDVPHYMGIDKLLHGILSEKAVSNGRSDSDPFINDPNIIGFIDKFERNEPYNVEMLESSHPQYCLLNCGQALEPQRKLFRYISERDIAVILYNGDGIELYHRSLDGESVKIGRFTADGCNWRPGAHSFKGVTVVSDVLQFMKDNGGVTRFPRIIVISGKLAGRGISFTSSDYGKYLHEIERNGSCKWMGWRLTSMYYIPSKSTSQPNLMQTIGRVCCIVRDNIPTYIYTNENVFSDICKSFWTQEELVIRARKLQRINSNLVFVDALNTVKMNTSKLCKRNLTINTAKRLKKENVVNGDDNGFDLTDVYNIVKQVSINIDAVEFTRLTTKMFILWAKDTSTRISHFMYELDPDKSYSRAEIDELCLHCNVRLGDVIIDKTGKSNKYGSIIEEIGMGICRLYPDLIASYKLCF